MANFVAAQAVNTKHLKELGHKADTGAGNFNSKTSAGFTFTQGKTSPTSVKVDFVMLGVGFKYILGYPYAGTITAMQVFVDGHLAYGFSNFQVSVSQMYDYWRSDNPWLLFREQFAGADHFLGSPFNDTLTAFTGNDFINGRGGDDTVLGAAGNDTLLGAAGNDVLNGGAGKDMLNGGPGLHDRADYAEKAAGVTVRLNAGTQVNVKVGTVVEDKIKNIEDVRGGKGADTLTGDIKANKLEGNGGNDTLSGAGGNDVLIGGTGADHLHGGTGNDELTGGDGPDRFYLDTALDEVLNLDTFVDFVPGVDKIVLDDAIFTALATGALDVAAFINGPAALTGDQHIIYDTLTMLGVGRLFYDPDGLLGADQIEIARLTGAPALSNSDIIVA